MRTDSSAIHTLSEYAKKKKNAKEEEKPGAGRRGSRGEPVHCLIQCKDISYNRFDEEETFIFIY